MSDERSRVVLMIDDELRAALRLEAAKRDVDMADVISELIRQHLAESVADVRKRRAEGETGGKGPKRK